MSNSLLRIVCAVLLCVTMFTAKAGTTYSENHTDSVYLFCYATNNPKDGAHFAYSYDKHRWTALGGNHSFFKSDFGTWGVLKNMFTPSFTQDERGEWYAVFGLGEKINQFATTLSKDLWLWKPQDYPYLEKGEYFSNPVLIYNKGVFELYFQSNTGAKRTVSKDFRNWEKPVAVTDAAFESVKRYVTISINGVEQRGEIHRVATQTVERLTEKLSLANQRGRSQNENCGDDANRFRGIKCLNARLQINLNDTKAISPDLIGIFFEDINYSADGGLYAELIQNRDFEYNSLDRGEWNAKSFWELKGEGSSFEIAEKNPIHENNPHYAVLTTTTKGASLQNGGFDGIVLKAGDKYDLSLFAKSFDGKAHKLQVSLIAADKVVACTVVSINAKAAWTRLQTVLKAAASVDNASLCISPLDEGKIGLDFVSLFPQKTFKNRKNGLRADLAQVLADLKPRFIRFPGGCVSHGNGIENMYRWRTTIGPLWERKHQSNIWGYHQSKGLGFYEYFQFCEDIGAEPLPVLPAGVPCQNSSRGGHGQQGGLSMDEMKDYAQELLDLIEWANGDARTSKLAKMRADAGHPAPFNLKYIGVGNEDLIGDVFTERFIYLNNIIKEKYPDIKVVGTVGPFFEGSDYEYGWQLAREQHVDIVDEHYYVNPGWYMNNQDFYDGYDRNGTKVYLGEWASWGSRMENALAEALHITNLERNADVVVMSSYAPLLAKKNHTQWNPDLIYFDNTSVSPTVNYYVQKMCGNNSGDQYVYGDLTIEATRDDNGKEVTAYNEDADRRINSSVVRDTKTGDVIIKLVNITPFDTPVTITFPETAKLTKPASVTCISGNPSDKEAKHSSSSLTMGTTTTYIMPAYSFSVIRVKGEVLVVK